MKIKGVHPVEQHFEKGVLALCVIGLLAAVALQFLGTPNQVDASGREVPPDQIYTVVADQASALQSQITDRSPSLPEVGEVDLLARYDAALGENRGRTELPAPLGRGVEIASLFEFEIDTASGDVGPIAALRVPAPTTPIPASNWATLDPFAIAEVPAFGDIVPGAQPYDFASVTVESEFSGTALRDALEGRDGAGGVPRTFWASTGMAVMALEAQRQRLLPDGSWGEPEPITRSPGAADPLSAVSPDDGLARLNETIANANRAADAVRRPEFPPTIAGAPWQPPSERAESGAELTEEERLTRRLARLEREVERLRAGPGAATPTRTASRGTRGGATRGTRGSARQPTRSTPAPGASRSGDRAQILEREIEQIRERLDELGVETDDAGDPGFLAPLLDQDRVQLWTHDLGAEPGATYRYRTRVVVNNPYFRKGPYLDEANAEEQALTRDPFTRGDWSAWSEPVRVGDKNLYFVDSATPPTPDGAPASARIELYTMYYGHYRRRSQSISPGDELIHQAAVSDTLVLIDPELADPAQVARYIESGAADDSPPEGVLAGRRDLRLSLGTILLEVMPDPLAPDPGTGVALLFRLADGTIDRRIAGADTASALYERVSDSASIGARATLRPPGASPARSPAAELFEPAEP